MELQPRLFGLSRPQADNCVFTDTKIVVPYDINTDSLKELYIDAPQREADSLDESALLDIQIATALYLAITYKRADANKRLPSISSLLFAPA